MKIRDKLFLGFSLYILLAGILGFFGYKDLRTITKRLMLVEVADDITNAILEVRRYEKNYLLYRDKTSLEELREYLGVLKKNVDNIELEMIREIGKDNYQKTKKAMVEYGGLIDKIVENFKLQEELVSMARDAGRRVEQKLGGRELQKFLILRRYEKNLMLYKDKETFGNFTRTYLSMNMDGEAGRYRMLVTKLYELYTDEKTSIERARSVAREIQSLTENLSKRERASISSILGVSMKMLLYGLFAMITLGAVVNLRLAMSISVPLRRLESITKKVAAGDFSEGIEVRGNDEIASLSASFNQMELKLKDSMKSLEYVIERLREKQAQLVEAEKLASIGKLAAGIAHEINNPLTSVLTFSSLMLEQTHEDDPRHKRLKMIVGETTRARNIVRQVLSFAKEAPLKKERMDVNRPVGEIIDSLVAQEAFKDIELITNLAGGLPELDIDPVQIGQVVLNVLLNAVHAITPPGKISVATRKEDGFVELVVNDTGKGIPGENLQKIFDPFFTTKDKTKGTGLGLAVSYGIIKKHGGEIEVSSTVGMGTTFTVKLPITGP
ncbi:MAG TPA: ATP-binding protein [Dissulfurispiraceae bacterium]